MRRCWRTRFGCCCGRRTSGASCATWNSCSRRGASTAASAGRKASGGCWSTKRTLPPRNANWTATRSRTSSRRRRRRRRESTAAGGACARIWRSSGASSRWSGRPRSVGTGAASVACMWRRWKTANSGVSPPPSRCTPTSATSSPTRSSAACSAGSQAATWAAAWRGSASSSAACSATPSTRCCGRSTSVPSAHPRRPSPPRGSMPPSCGAAATSAPALGNAPSRRSSPQSRSSPTPASATKTPTPWPT